jgi:PmbA protein
MSTTTPDPAAVLAALQRAGASQAQVRLSASRKHELNAEWGEVSLLRSTFDRQLTLVAVTDDRRRATLTLNDTSEAGVTEAVQQVVELARSSRPDDSNALVEGGPAATFESGTSEPDLDAMCGRLEEFLAWAEASWPTSSLRGVHLDFTHEHTTLRSTTGIDLAAQVGAYQAVAVFSARDGADVSSFNYTAWQGRALDQPLAEVGSFARLLEQSTEQLHPRPVGRKFVGEVIVTPDCLPSFIRPLEGLLSDGSLIAGTSVFKEALGETIADSRLTLRSRPAAAERARPSFLTADGRPNDEAMVIDRGVLRSFLLSHRGALRTGLPQGASDGGGYEIEPGPRALDELIGGVDRGVLLCRFSGGRPSDNGDFSGVAKNSYLIEDGRITAPLAETMVSGNLVRMLKSVRGVSRDHVDFGFCDLPWVSFGGLTVS